MLAFRSARARGGKPGQKKVSQFATNIRNAEEKRRFPNTEYLRYRAPEAENEITLKCTVILAALRSHFASPVSRLHRNHANTAVNPLADHAFDAKSVMLVF